MPSTIPVTGGSGTLGSHVVRAFRARGCQMRVLSPRERAGSDGVEYVVGDLATGRGVEEAVASLDAIGRCADPRKGDADATQNLVMAANGAEKAAPPRLHLRGRGERDSVRVLSDEARG